MLVELAAVIEHEVVPDVEVSYSFWQGFYLFVHVMSELLSHEVWVQLKASG